VLICIVGIIGSCTRKRWLIILYIGLVLLVLFFELGVLIYVSIESQYVESKIQNLMYTSLVMYFIPVQLNANGFISNATNNASASWEVMQFQYGCCGAYGYTDYMNFTWQTRNPSTNYHNLNATVPPSCCEQIVQYQLPSSTKQIVNLTSCMMTPPNYTNTKGCYTVLSEVYFVYGYVKIIVIAGLLAIEVIVSILSARLLQAERDSDKSYG